MKKVVLFKSVSDEYEKVFNEQNYQVLFVEPLQFLNINVEQLNEKLLSDDYSGLILTSPRAVEALGKCWNPSKFIIWNSKKVYTVGEASSHQIKLLLGLDALGTTSGSAENLAKIIVEENSEGSKFLFPSGNLSSDVMPQMLKAKNMSVDSLTVYETKENEKLCTDLMKADAEEGLCCVVFFSPSGCDYVHRQLQTFNNRLFQLPHFAIGNTTAHKIENLGLEIAGVAEKPRAESVLESIEKYFANPIQECR